MDNGLELDSARCLAKKGDFDHALGFINGVLLEDPKNTEALFLQGGIYLKLGRPAQAMESWEKILAINPSHQKAHEWVERLQHKHS